MSVMMPDREQRGREKKQENIVLEQLRNINGADGFTLFELVTRSMLVKGIISMRRRPQLCICMYTYIHICICTCTCM